MSVVYVSPAGQDSQEGSIELPLRTITQALKQAGPGEVVQLAPGLYQAGEQFPLAVPAGVTLVGSDAQRVTIQGGGAADGVNVTVVLGDRAQIREVTLTNPQGSGILSAEGAALIIRSRLVKCLQHGVLVTGRAHPFVSDNDFVENEATGIAITAQAKGEIRQNRFSRNGYGIALADQCAPLAIDNRLMGDRCAIVIENEARPVLRQNQAIGSREIGLWVQDRTQPDIGQPQDPGSNQFEGKTYDVRNDGTLPLATAGNQLDPTRVKGSVAYLPSEIPDQAAVPEVLLGNVEPVPVSESPLSDSVTDPGEGVSLDSRFADLVGHWSAPLIEAMADRNLVKGFLNGTFQPDSPVNRAQFAALLAASFPAVERDHPISPFADVSADFWGAEAIRQVQSQGFISGFPDGSFRPNAPLTRVQAIVALVNGLELGRGRSAALWVYGDRAQVPSYAIEPVAAATERQLIVSYPDPDRLRPLEPATRAETTAMVHQALVAIGKLPRIASPFIQTADVGSASFRDVSAQYWAQDFIEPLVQKGWLSGFGDGSFRPDEPITRAQFAALLVGAFSPEPARPPVRFRDVPADFWAADVIQRAYRANFISGFPDLTFDPNYPLTKLQALLALVSGLALQSVSPPDERSLDRFMDRSAIPNYATRAIATATQLGLVFNRPVRSELRPNRAATRAEAAAMVYQALVLADKVPPVTSPAQILD
ncbi:MAG: S-layer homology domain-containing protein [Phormidesmis sp.]